MPNVEPIPDSNPGTRMYPPVVEAARPPEPPVPPDVSADVRYLAEVQKWGLGTVRGEVVALRHDQARNFAILQGADKRIETKLDAHGRAWGWLTGTAKAFSDPQFVQRSVSSFVGILAALAALYGGIRAAGWPTVPGAVLVAQPDATETVTVHGDPQ